MACHTMYARGCCRTRVHQLALCGAARTVHQVHGFLPGKLMLTQDNYREELSKPGLFATITDVYLWWHGESGEQEFKDMVGAFASRSGFENVSTILIWAASLSLDGTVMQTIAKGKPRVKNIELKAFEFRTVDSISPESVWEGLTQLRVVHIQLTDSCTHPGGFNYLVSGLPKAGLEELWVEDKGTHYGMLDCTLVPKCNGMIWLRGLTLKNRSLLPRLCFIMVDDCKECDDDEKGHAAKHAALSGCYNKLLRRWMHRLICPLKQQTSV